MPDETPQTHPVETYMTAMLPDWARIIGTCRTCRYFQGVTMYDEAIDREYGTCITGVTETDRYPAMVYPAFGCLHWSSVTDKEDRP